MKLGLKQVSWRTLGIVVLGLALIASVTINFVALHSTAKANATATRHGVIAAGKTPIHVTATGQVDWSKLPTVSKSPAAATHGRQVPTDLDRMTKAQRAAYLQALKSGKIKAPFAPTQTLPATAQQPTVPNPNFDACGYTNLPCKVYGFAGMNSTVSGGWYPPDQALAVNSSQVMEGLNNVFALYNFSGSTIYGPTSSFTFFASILHGSDVLSDPQMYWDASRQHFIIVEIEIAQNGSTTSDYYDIAVSKAQSGNLAPSNWYLYQFAANVNVGGSANWCDYPTLGNDYWGLWLDCVAFGQTSGSFLGNAVFALNKTGLYAGNASALNITYWTQVPTGVSNGSGGFQPAYRLSSVNEDGTPDAEFLVATDAGYGGPFTDLTTVAFTNTHAITLGGSNAPSLSYVITTLPVSYTDPIGAAEPGTTATVYPGFGTKQIEYKGGNLYIALSTAVNSGTHDGVYWAEVQPQLSGLDPAHPQNQVVQNTLVRQAAIWAFSNADAYMGSFEASSEDDEVLSFNVSSSTIYPSIVYTGRRATDPLNSIGDGNNYAYAVVGTHSNDSTRWGDYSACALVLNLTTRGTIFCAGEYGGPNTSLGGTGWDTYIYGLRVE